MDLGECNTYTRKKKQLDGDDRAIHSRGMRFTCMMSLWYLIYMRMQVNCRFGSATHVSPLILCARWVSARLGPAAVLAVVYMQSCAQKSVSLFRAGVVVASLCFLQEHLCITIAWIEITSKIWFCAHLLFRLYSSGGYEWGSDLLQRLGATVCLRKERNESFFLASQQHHISTALEGTCVWNCPWYDQVWLKEKLCNHGIWNYAPSGSDSMLKCGIGNQCEGIQKVRAMFFVLWLAENKF